MTLLLLYYDITIINYYNTELLKYHNSMILDIIFCIFLPMKEMELKLSD